MGEALHQIVRSTLGLDKSIFCPWRNLSTRYPPPQELKALSLPRCLQTPLDRLSITNCRHLMHSDLIHLFQCPKIRQLKTLYLCAVSLKHFKPEPLRDLLEAVAPTLQYLGLDNCAMVDSQVEAILPVLSRCHQLREFTISESNFSTATVEKLLRHTAGLPSLELELYPVPRECYTTQGAVRQDRLALVRAELTGILRELGQPRTVFLGIYYCHQCGNSQFYDVEFLGMEPSCVPVMTLLSGNTQQKLCSGSLEALI